MKTKRIIVLGLAFLALFGFGNFTAVASANDQLPRNEVDYKNVNMLVVPVDLPKESECFRTLEKSGDFNEILANSGILMKIGDPYPQNPEARVCSESKYYKSDVAKVLNELGTSENTIINLGLASAIDYLISKLASKGLGVIGTVWIGLEHFRVKSNEWWAEALAKITLGKATYVKQTIYCNYSGRYPRAYKILTLH